MYVHICALLYVCMYVCLQHNGDLETEFLRLCGLIPSIGDTLAWVEEGGRNGRALLPVGDTWEGV